MYSAEVVIIGGGLLGTAIGYGLAEMGGCPLIIDQSDPFQRASQGNFGLVWFQGKGFGNRAYASWSLKATDCFAEFARKIEAETGMDLFYRRTGGLVLTLGRDEWANRAGIIEALAAEAGDENYACKMVDRRWVEHMIPKMKIGREVTGGSYSPCDGHVNPLFLLRALRYAMQRKGGRIITDCPALGIDPNGTGFFVRIPGGGIAARKVVLAAGNGIPALARDLGMQVPVRPQRGQIMVTERVRPLLPFPISGIRQTNEGTFLLGFSKEEVGFDINTTMPVLKTISARVLRVFPELSRLRIIRSWAALRVITPDMAPIYEESATFPGAFVVTSHSGVTLAPLHAGEVAEWIISGEPAALMKNFRFRWHA